MEKEKNEKLKTTTTYYGKKMYCINPLIARKKPMQQTRTACLYEDVEDEILAVINFVGKKI